MKKQEVTVVAHLLGTHFGSPFGRYLPVFSKEDNDAENKINASMGGQSESSK